MTPRTWGLELQLASTHATAPRLRGTAVPIVTYQISRVQSGKGLLVPAVLTSHPGQKTIIVQRAMMVITLTEQDAHGLRALTVSLMVCRARAMPDITVGEPG